MTRMIAIAALLLPVGSTLSASDLPPSRRGPDLAAWSRDGVPALVVGAEDGYLCYLRRETAP